MVHSIDYIYLYTDNRRIPRRRTVKYRRATTWRNFLSCDRDPGKLEPQFGSSDQMASICSDCAHGRIYNSQALEERHSETVLL